MRETYVECPDCGERYDDFHLATCEECGADLTEVVPTFWNGHPLARESLDERFKSKWVAADEWASWMFPKAYLPRFEDVPKVRGMEPRRPLHERIQECIDRVNPETAPPRGPWMADLRLRTPGDAGDSSGYRITDFELTVDGDTETDDRLDAARMFVGTRQTEALGEYDPEEEAEADDWDDVDWEAAAEELEHDGFVLDEVIVHPSVFPGDARTLAEGEALVGTHPKHETLEERPGPCIICGEDEVHVTVWRNLDGGIEVTELECQECGWQASGGPADD